MNTIEIILLVISIISIIIGSISLHYTLKTKKRYEKIAMKLGNGEDISHILKEYIQKVEEINKRDDQIIEYCNKISEESFKFIKKIGLVRYDAFNNTKHDLSFAVALLNKENSGLVLNSVYGEDNSNIYAKEIVKGECRQNLSEEEKKAIEKAIKNK